MLVSNLLMHAEYKRRWKAVKDLSNVYTRFHQATGWFARYDVKQNPRLLKRWLEYLLALNLEQFDANVMFLKDSVRALPHIVTGNQMRITKTSKLLEFLFLWDDNRERKAWGSLPFRLVLQQSFEFIKSQLGYQRASAWLEYYLYLVRLTHWILPYPSSNALIQSTKESAAKGQTGQIMWFLSIFAHPTYVRM
ncbi:hypothetical protein N0V95_009711 [Ascochyta clinopodiicola]|nr:hypothetical protein N0V95_009711 [Ascochyta clinopodiicola]